MSIPYISTDRLILRPFRPADVAPLHQILAQPGILRYFPNPEAPDLQRVERIIAFQSSHWEKYAYGWWAVELPGVEDMIGWCGLQYLPETNETEVAYLLNPEHWGRGLGTEAARFSLRYGFRNLHLNRIVAIVHPDNLVSRRVIKKLGMHFVDRAVYFGMDCFRYELFASLFSKQKEQ